LWEPIERSVAVSRYACRAGEVLKQIGAADQVECAMRIMVSVLF